MSAPSLHQESTDSLSLYIYNYGNAIVDLVIKVPSHQKVLFPLYTALLVSDVRV